MRRVFQTSLLEYETPKIVQLGSPLVGVTYRLVQATIIVYVVVYMFIINHGYQYIDLAISSGTTSKVKGIALTNSQDPRVGQRVWDTSDLVIPPDGKEGFFLTTNIIQTHHQTQGTCPKVQRVQIECHNDSDCLPVGESLPLDGGISTGECSNLTGTCMVRAWCPLENDNLPENGSYAMIRNTKDFTVFIKSHVHFSFYKKTRSNVIETVTEKYLSQCVYNAVTDPYCPVFRIADIVSLAVSKSDPSDEHFEMMAIKGGVVSITVEWDCNFDLADSECRPTYTFRRLDNYEGNSLSSGYNFRYTKEFIAGGIHRRQLVKAFGILFIINVEARGRSFHLITFLQNLGAGLGLLGLATVFCDMLLVNCHVRKASLKKHIYHHVKLGAQDMNSAGPILNRLVTYVSRISRKTPDNHMEGNYPEPASVLNKS